MLKTCVKTFLVIAFCMLVVCQLTAQGSDPSQLKTTLTPLGGEKAGNKDGTIPAWTGGYTTPIPGYKAGGHRGDPFANEKPLFSISAKNMDQYSARLTDGTKAMMKKYPATGSTSTRPSAREWLRSGCMTTPSRTRRAPSW
jgi:hypothetical protein